MLCSGGGGRSPPLGYATASVHVKDNTINVNAAGKQLQEKRGHTNVTIVVKSFKLRELWQLSS